MRFVPAVLVALSSTLTVAAQQTPFAGSAQSSTTPTAQVTPSVQQGDVDAMRDDLKRMKVLVQQMEMNLAFVDTAQTPLKHQFQLEIDMWKTLIDQMERRLNATKAR